MLGKALAAVVVAAFIAVVPTAAYAAPAITPSVVAGDEDYTPGQHTVPSLDGSSVSSECIRDVPWIGYSVVMTDPDAQATERTAVLVLSSGSNSTTIPLGTLDSSGRLSGSVLWPGASVDEQGNATGWPGYEYIDGQWVQTSGNFAWTRGPITAVIEVNPELTVPLSYPAETAECASPTSDTPAPPLAVTGSTFDPAPLLFAGGAFIAVGALAVVLMGRRAARRN